MLLYKSLYTDSCYLSPITGFMSKRPFPKRQGLVEAITRDFVLCDEMSPMRDNLMGHFACVLWNLKIINN